MEIVSSAACMSVAYVGDQRQRRARNPARITRRSDHDSSFDSRLPFRAMYTDTDWGCFSVLITRVFTRRALWTFRLNHCILFINRHTRSMKPFGSHSQGHGHKRCTKT